MKRIVILAFGSLIEDPGKQLEPFIRERISNIQSEAIHYHITLQP